MTVLKRCGAPLLPHLTRVINAVIVCGWPPEWKVADVVALWKRKG